MVMADDGNLREQAGLFEVAVGDAPRRVCLQHELGLDSVREWEPPDVSLSQGVKVNTSHTNFGCIGGP
jgi:hypothetical protein